VNVQAQLTKGIKAAKHGDKVAARLLFYEVLDQQPRNETAWVWLSYVVDSAEDRQVCLENVLTINPNNSYAQRGLSQLQNLALTRSVSSSPINKINNKIKPKPYRRPLPLILVIAFWAGIGILFLVAGLIDMIGWGADIAISRTFPRYITTYQLMTLTISITLFVIGVVSGNLAWALYQGHKSGYFISIILSLGLVLAGPITLLILDSPNYVLVVFVTVMPISVLFLTLLSQTGFINDRQLASNARRD